VTLLGCEERVDTVGVEPTDDREYVSPMRAQVWGPFGPHEVHLEATPRQRSRPPEAPGAERG